MNEPEKNKVLIHSTSSIAIPVKSLDTSDQTFPSSHSESNWARRTLSSLYQCIPGVMNPRSKTAQIFSKLFILMFSFIFLFESVITFLIQSKQDDNCIIDLSTFGVVWVNLKNSTLRIIFLLHIIFRFRVAYVDPESRVLVYNPKKVALNYLFGYFVLDFILVLPMPEKIIDWMTDIYSSGTLDLAYFLQYMTFICRLLSMLADLTTAAFVYNSWLSKFVVNLLAFFLFSHVVGSLWYNFAVFRVSQCLEIACGEPSSCYKYIYCLQRNKNGNYEDDPTSWKKWENNKSAAACFGPDGYDYGIYEKAVSLMNKSTLPVRYIYSLFWGFQQISTLAGNQTPSFFVVEILFTMFISAAGLLLFSLLIGNIQNFLQALGRRKLEMSVRGLDIEQWMRHRRFPEELKCQVRESEQYNWLTSRGVDELMLLENLPDDLQRDIRRHLIKFDEKFPTIALMDESLLDSIREKMQIKTYIKGSKILVRGGLNDKLVFIVHGNLESIGEDENVVRLGEGDVCGEELVTLCLERYVLNRDGEKFRIPAQKLLSKRMIRCLTNVEAFTLRAVDLEDVFGFYSGLLINNPLVQGAIKMESVNPKRLSRSKSY